MKTIEIFWEQFYDFQFLYPSSCHTCGKSSEEIYNILLNIQNQEMQQLFFLPDKYT